MALDQDKLQQFLQKALDEIGATFHASLVVIGDQLGLYKAMAGAGPLTSVELAERTNTAERYVREWLAAQAASGYVTYESTTGRFLLSEEQEAVSKLKKCQGKCDFHGGKRAVADEIRAALR